MGKFKEEIKMYKTDYIKNKKNNEINKVKQKIEELTKLSELKVEEFAPEGGYADKIAQEIKGHELKPTQLRKFFDELRSIQREMKIGKDWEEVKDRVLLLTPILAYASARKVGRKPLIPREFYKLISACINKVKTKEDFETFVEFFQSIVAYHKYYFELEKG